MYVERVPFGYDKSANEGTRQLFCRNLGQFPHLPENKGTRRRIQSRDIKITPYPQLFVTYSRAVQSPALRSNKEQTKLEKKYSLESTDPRESEIRAPPQPIPYLMPILPNTLFYKKIVHIDDADLDVSDTCVRNSLLS